MAILQNGLRANVARDFEKCRYPYISREGAAKSCLAREAATSISDAKQRFSRSAGIWMAKSATIARGTSCKFTINCMAIPSDTKVALAHGCVAEQGA
jgi:hypothetical protein